VGIASSGGKEVFESPSGKKNRASKRQGEGKKKQFEKE